ncbi:MAG: pyruvate kinase [Candidatus Peregrinibacteria bacterium]|nr:pyruvate kinase [Candidatus Peregrinibacteria bacterium]
MRFTKIVCSVGPATSTPAQIEELARMGMNVARINLSHGTREQHLHFIRTLKDLNDQGKYCVAVMLDTKGTEIRTGDVTDPIVITKGDEVVFSPIPCPDEKRKVIIVSYDGFSKDVRDAERILIDNGEITFELLSTETNGRVIARALDNGSIGKRRHVNLPGADIDLPTFSPQDWDDMAFAAEEQVDYVALSFVRSAADVEQVRLFLQEKRSAIRIIAKIETRQAVDDIAEILRVSDGIMVARGDLGAEMPFERLPVIQDQIVALCKEAGKPVIVATHMLESMINHPMPTRAEVTDIAHAATTGADATMLSAESSIGQYAFAAVDAMDRVLQATEAHLKRFAPMEDTGVHDEREARAEAAVTLAVSTEAAALVVITRTGKSAVDIAKFRPRIPIIAFTHRPDIQRSLQMSYGILPLLVSFHDDPEQTVDIAMEKIHSLKLFPSGTRIVLVSDAKAHEQAVNTIQIRSIP